VKFEPGHIPVYLVQLDVFERATGYTPDAVQKKIQRGEWREGIHFRRAPDGRLLMDLRGYHAWAEGQRQAA
jgi:hypothetical protein